MTAAGAPRPCTTPERAGHVAARIGRLLLVNGADTAHAQRCIGEIARAFGYDAQTLITAEAILVTLATIDGVQTRVGHAILAMAVDMGRLVALERIGDDIRAGMLDADDADRRLDAVEAGSGGHAAPLVVVGVALTAASLTRLFGGDWPVVGAAFVAGVVSTVLRRALAERHVNAIAATFIIAFVSGLCGALVIRLAPGSSPVLCLTAAGVILVPGVPLINGVRDLVYGHAGNGIARLTLGSATVLAIGFALYLAAAAAGDTLPVGSAPGTLPVLEDLFFSAVAAAGYATLFGLPFGAVWVCALCGMASHGLRTVFGHVGLDIATASLIGAFAAGLIARVASRAYRMPPVAFAFPGIVAMIPGSYGFRAGIAGLHLMTEGAAASPLIVADTLSLAITTAVMTLAIGIGLTLSLSTLPHQIRGHDHG